MIEIQEGSGTDGTWCSCVGESGDRYIVVSCPSCKSPFAYRRSKVFGTPQWFECDACGLYEEVLLIGLGTLH